MIKGYITFIDRLNNKRFTYFQRTVVKSAKSIPIQGYALFTDLYSKNIDDFEAFSSGRDVSEARSKMLAAKQCRTDAFKELKRTVKQWKNSTNRSERCLGKVLLHLFRGSSKVDHITGDKAITFVGELIDQFRPVVNQALYAPIYAGSKIESLFSQLVSAESTYLAANREYQDKKRKHSEVSSESLRDACMNKYVILVVTAYLLAEFHHSEECKQFLETVSNLEKTFCTQGTPKPLDNAESAA